MKTPFNLFLVIFLITLTSCSTDDIRNIAGSSEPKPQPGQPTAVEPVDINSKGFELMQKMQGHWVGRNLVIATDYTWFGWDYRPISASHTFGIHEGGSAGNLFNSFFVSNFKGKRTLMIRNGGVLNGIYRTSYFVLDKVENNADSDYYRFVDARGGDGIMFMEYRFPKATDSLYFNAYTSNLGDRIPNRHMTFRAKRMHPELAQAAAAATNYPKNEVEIDFANGFVEENLYVKNGLTEANSATFLAQQENNDVFEMAPLSGDPYTILDHPSLSILNVKIERGQVPADKTLLVYLSRDPLTDTEGFYSSDPEAFNTLLHFPVLTQGENEFLFTYIHPGDYYVTIIADMDGDLAPSEGDLTHAQRPITIAPESENEITITDITTEN
ncbi:hypothetical protein [Sediminicola luteus]|uniref:Uncharacterized protein n=1 Tax=Sediminicola luteus TaxID=319238 RepID=A0A2A4G8N5_9FLAO|nr:hypothetical protein [Sediminicola luteus]PCE64793.1 hypothetical protein B7P33_06380 [Sediminicola luteus]